MPFADDGGLVANALQELGEVELAIVVARVQGGHAVDVIVRAGEDGRAGGAANGIGAKTVVKAHAALGDAVEVGRGVDAAAIATHGVGRVVVGHNEEDVGAGHERSPVLGVKELVDDSDGRTATSLS